MPKSLTPLVSDRCSIPPTGKTTLKASQLLQGVLRPTRGRFPEKSITSLSIPHKVYGATAQLVQIVQTLCDPESDWPIDKPQTPQTLLPYVSDEAEELIVALSQWQAQVDSVAAPCDLLTGSSPLTGASMPGSTGALTAISDLVAHWLWGIAASSPLAMELLEGCLVNQRVTNGEHRVEGLRLAPILKLSLAGTRYELDLVAQTLQGPKPVTVLQAEDVGKNAAESASSTHSRSDWLAYLWEQLLICLPTLSHWRQGQAVQVLLTGQGWQQGTCALDLQLIPLPLSGIKSSLVLSPRLETVPALSVGMPVARVWSRGSPDLETDCPQDQTSLSPAPLYPSLETQVTFLDRAWCRGAIAASLDLYLGQQFRPHATAEPAPKPPPEALTLVQRVHDRVGRNRQPSSIPDAHLLQSPLTLTRLCRQVHWLWLRVAQSLMPLMQGIPVCYLQPGTAWQTGTLVASLKLRFAQIPNSEPVELVVGSAAWHSSPASDTLQGVVHLQSMSFQHTSVWEMTELQTILEQTLAQHCPVLASLMAGTSVRLIPTDQEPLPTAFTGAQHLTLSLGLTFYVWEQNPQGRSSA